MHLFHCPDLTGDQPALPAEEAHHALHVLRLKEGGTVGLLDGKGGLAEAEILRIDKHSCTVRIRHRHPVEPLRPVRIHLAVAPTKQIERLEWFLEKATEVGVDRITPILTQRTERSKLRHDRLKKMIIGAMKQSQRRWLPQLDALTKLGDLESDAPQKFFGWCEGEHAPFTSLYDPTQSALMVIGPEGDFTSEEAEAMLTQGFRAVSLGRARLRTETAALAACTWMSFRQQA